MSEKERRDNIERWLGEASHTNKKLSVLVEGLGDVPFWSNLLSHFIPNLQYHEIDFPFYSSKGTMGKDEIMQYKDFLSKELILCRDSDNEYLYKPQMNWLSNSFLYQTYTYTKENHLCYAQNLNKICTEITLQHFDFEPFIREYSRIAFPVLLNWLYYFPSKKKSSNPFISKVNLEKILSIEEDLKQVSNLQNLVLVHHALQERIDNWIVSLDNDASHFENKEPISGLNPENTIFYLSGHIVFPKVIKPLFEKVISFLKINYEQVNRQELSNATENVINNRLKEYNNRINRIDISTVLKQSYKECLMKNDSCNFLAKIQAEIQRDFNSFNTNS